MSDNNKKEIVEIGSKQIEYENLLNQIYHDYYYNKKYSRMECESLLNINLNKAKSEKVFNWYELHSVNKRRDHRTIVGLMDSLRVSSENELKTFLLFFNYLKSKSNTEMSYIELGAKDTSRLMVSKMKKREDSPFKSDYKILNFNEKEMLVEIKNFKSNEHLLKICNLYHYAEEKPYMVVRSHYPYRYFVYMPHSFKIIIDYFERNKNFVFIWSDKESVSVSFGDGEHKGYSLQELIDKKMVVEIFP